MLRQVAGYIRMHGLTPEDRCLSLMPMFHGHGINSGVCGPLCAGGSTSMLRPFDIDSFARCIETLDPTWYTGAYTFHHQILAHADRLKDVVARSRLRFARSGSGRLERAVIEQLERAFGIPHVQAYSSSETGLIACNPMPPALRKLDGVGLPADPATAIVDERGRPLPAGERGEVALPIDNVFGGYENDPPANRAAFRGGWYRTGDEGYADADGYLFLTGRIKEMINRGGEKITPAEVEAALLTHPGVRAAAVFPIPHATLGEEVAAAIVRKERAGPGEAELAAHLRSTLADFKAPRRYVFVDRIPYGATGKVARRQLAADLGLAAGAPVHDRPAASGERIPTALEAQLQELWAEALRLDPVGLDDDFFLLGGDSLQAVELFLAIEQELGQRLPRAILFEAGTISAMARRIAEYRGSPCLVPISPVGVAGSERPPFFCVHGSDGNAVYFRDLARLLGPSQPFYALQSVGLDGLEEPLTRIEDIAARYLAEIRGVQPRGPYFIGGFSFGGRVAWVMAQRLRAAGEEVALLALIDTFSLTGEDRLGLWQATLHRARQMARLPWRALPGYLAARARNLFRAVAMRLPQPVYASIAKPLSSPGRTVPRSLRLSPYEAHGMASRAFVPTPYEGDAVLFSAVGNRRGLQDGWAGLVRGKLEIRDLPGGHYDILGQPQVRALARELDAVLAERQARSAPALRQAARTTS
jgi:thioesterase domain-containing protein/acyl carrier protein